MSKLGACDFGGQQAGQKGTINEQPLTLVYQCQEHRSQSCQKVSPGPNGFRVLCLL